ncbi:hypothetical protein I307_04397 [Cryptococcus deuterogattii 99/473]|uniref:EGF-like domain-containing protein n=1 Tax=Cryptococcus deuterogattii Ram5 TaxID=1296110 RepID=A0A0D0V1M0_9TREE|nr:hypothetical protein I309_04735 [Cryptococcus deuterogattii LA55]KIR41316.1 hypothetical protein I313_02442 [Cryptococcus deuterogattii Ram5]KIR89942.1 hypothetical protein I304_06188 [Cryptococcus deuterogattii CBS 10090]KIY56286.1 hypothetical protein I307_04397 [Cryptococcus deuterogattii 99/473]
MLTYTGSLLFALSGTAVWAKSQVCSASECIEGYSTSPLLALDSSSLTYLLPGTYSSTSYSPTSPLNASIFTTSSSLTISTPDSPVGFTSRSYSGSGNVWTGNDWGMSSWKSIYLPNGWYAVLGQGKVLWGAIPEKNLLPMSVSSMGISYVGISACSPACSSRGTCIATNTSATCKCDEGWAGSICDSCATGYYGTSCTGEISEIALSSRMRNMRATSKHQLYCRLHVLLFNAYIINNQSYHLCVIKWNMFLRIILRFQYIFLSKLLSSLFYLYWPWHIRLSFLCFSSCKSPRFLSCPAGCLSCYIPGFSNAASYESLICQVCQEGYLLEDGQCVKRCSDGWFLPEESATTSGTCHQCDSSCSTCISTSTTCLSCSSFSMSAHSGSCIPSSSCPSPTVSLNGTCVTCPLDCATCSSASTCATCHSGRPILKDGRCVAYCAKDTYYDINTGTCQACDWTCKSCVGEGSAMCSSCSDGYMLKNGVCVNALCGDGGFANGFGMCLSSFVHKSQKRHLGFLALIGVAMVAGIVFWLHVRRERRKIRQATKEFGERLDKRNVNDRLAALRLEEVFGLNRVTLGRGGDRSTQTTREDGSKKNKLRELLFPSKRRSGDEEMEMKKSNFAPDKERDRYDGWGTSNLGRDSWIAPPPYIASQARFLPRFYNHPFHVNDFAPTALALPYASSKTGDGQS